MKKPAGYNKCRVCPGCGQTKTTGNTRTKVFGGEVYYGERCRSCCTSRLKKWREDNREMWLETNRRNASIRREKVRRSVFEYYGRACVCCGETHSEFLTIDHIDGGGNAERKRLGTGGSVQYEYLVKNGFPDGYRTLCWNCNASYGMRGYCPHNGTDAGSLGGISDERSSSTGKRTKREIVSKS